MKALAVARRCYDPMLSRVMPDLVVRQQLLQACGHQGYVLDANRGGPTVVVLASTLVLARSYMPTIGALWRRGMRVIVIEFPGSGHGSVLWRPWSFEQYARWTSALFEQLHIERATFVGHSMSGAIAVDLAAAGDPRVARIVLADTIGASNVGPLLAVLVRRAIDCWFEPILTLGAWHHVLLNAIYHPISFWDQVRLSGQGDITGVLPRVKVPVLLAWGQRDHTMPLRCARELHALLPRSILHVEPRVSHDWLITDASRFAKSVERFIAGTG